MGKVTCIVNYGGWRGRPDNSLMQYKESDRHTITLYANWIVRDQNGQISAAETVKNVRKKLEETQGPNFDHHICRWEKAACFKDALGKEASRLTTYIHEKLGRLFQSRISRSTLLEGNFLEGRG